MGAYFAPNILDEEAFYAPKLVSNWKHLCPEYFNRNMSNFALKQEVFSTPIFIHKNLEMYAYKEFFAPQI